MLSDRQFGDLSDHLRKNGGFSANAHTGSAPSDGFMVSLPGHEQQVATAKVSGGTLKGFANDHSGQLQGGDRYLGGWDNEGQTSLDVSQNIVGKSSVAKQYGDSVAHADARTSAEDLAVARNQESVYDVRKDDVFFNQHFDSSRR